MASKERTNDAKRSGARNRVVGDSIHDTDAMNKEDAIRAIAKRECGEKTVLASFRILTATIDCGFAIEICLVGRKKDSLFRVTSGGACIDMDLD